MTAFDIALPARTSTVTSSDGTAIAYHTSGVGPGVVILPGALSTGADYAALAAALSQTFTVHVIERRGRGGSGPQGPAYSIDRECEDLDAVRAVTAAAFVFGHSYGGLVALEAASRTRAWSRVAVYEPGVSINGSIPVAWIPAYRHHLATGRSLDAFITFIRALGPGIARVAPHWWMKLIMGFVMSDEERTRRFSLLAENLTEHAEVGRLDNTYPRYAAIAAELCLMVGGKSGSTARLTGERLAQVKPGATIRILPGLDHFGPDQGDPRRVAAELKRFFTADPVVFG